MLEYGNCIFDELYLEHILEKCETLFFAFFIKSSELAVLV